VYTKWLTLSVTDRKNHSVFSESSKEHNYNIAQNDTQHKTCFYRSANAIFGKSWANSIRRNCV